MWLQQSTWTVYVFYWLLLFPLRTSPETLWPPIEAKLFLQSLLMFLIAPHHSHDPAHSCPLFIVSLLSCVYYLILAPLWIFLLLPSSYFSSVSSPPLCPPPPAYRTTTSRATHFRIEEAGRNSGTASWLAQAGFDSPTYLIFLVL